MLKKRWLLYLIREYQFFTDGDKQNIRDKMLDTEDISKTKVMAYVLYACHKYNKALEVLSVPLGLMYPKILVKLLSLIGTMA